MNNGKEPKPISFTSNQPVYSFLDSKEESASVRLADVWPTNKKELFGRVYDTLVKTAGANPNQKDSFIHNHCDSKWPCDEWRFCGLLGSGGKYWRKTNSVSCYREDETKERLTIIKKTNEELSALSDELTKIQEL